MSTSQELTKKNLVMLRSRALQKARAFFISKNYYEVDCPILSPYAALDNHIDLFSTATSPAYFLHSSPEYGMKKLLCQGAPSIFQISHVFRANESGSKHAQEFTMAEFYKLNIRYEDFIEETCQFLELFLGQKKKVYFSYEEAFINTIKLNPFCQIDKIKEMIQQELCFNVNDFPDDDVLTIAMGGLVEPRFDSDVLTVITNFPHTQAALAEVSTHNSCLELAMRFEIYYKGFELCNGYKEEKNPAVLKKRFEELNCLRQEQEKSAYPIDHELLNLMKKSFPDCCGVACGFDRLFMLECGILDIKDALALPSV